MDQFDRDEQGECSKHPSSHLPGSADSQVVTRRTIQPSSSTHSLRLLLKHVDRSDVRIDDVVVTSIAEAPGLDFRAATLRIDSLPRTGVGALDVGPAYERQD